MNREIRRRTLALSLSLTLAFPGGAAHASPEGDADDLIEASQRNARLTAHRTLMMVLNEALSRSQPEASALLPIAQAQSSLEQSLRAIRASLERTHLAGMDAESLVRDGDVNLSTLDQALNDYVTNYETAQLEARRLLERFRSAQARVIQAKDRNERIRRDMLEICTRGIAVNVDTRTLPSVTVRAPKFQISFSARSSTDGSGAQAQPGTGREQEEQKYGLYIFPIFDTWAGKDASEYNAAASYTTMVGLYAAFGGFSAVNAGAALAAGAAAGGVTIVIAVAILVVQDLLARDEGRRVADAMERVFWDRADAMTVAREMQTACQPIAAKLDAVPADTQAVLSETTPGPATARLEKRRADTAAFLTKIQTLGEARAKAAGRLRQEGKAGDDLTLALARSPEGRAYDDFIADRAMEKMGEALAVNLISTAIHIDREDTDFAALSKRDLENADGLVARLQKQTPRLRERLWTLTRLRMELSLDNQRADLARDLRREVSLNESAIALHREWQDLYARAIRGAFLGLATPLETAGLTNLLERLRAERKVQPESALLSLLERRTESLLRALKEIGP